NRAHWADGSCRECECNNAQVTCYLHSCPSCPPGTLAVRKEGQCCPECQHGTVLSCKDASCNVCVWVWTRIRNLFLFHFKLVSFFHFGNTLTPHTLTED
ncbi:hypothetical protein XENOCAPTIV_017577, partial [Xenoophorus captivus]